ncbi:hypothetical protein [Sphingomonas sp.]|uniref:hypothetical protein n=1 Tax=Sphingomonas sp. TaxID=28214 RepID=UPI003B3A6686
MMKSFCMRHGLALALLPLAAVASAQTEAPKTVTTTRTTQSTVATPSERTTTTTTTTREKIADTGKEAGRIASQPARDVGASKVAIPAPVRKAAAAPYSLKGLSTCTQIRQAIFELNDVLGPDYAGAVTTRENKAGKLAAAGGKTIVNTIIPFRGLVREVSGAAPAERRLNAAIRAAYARRGFLRGVATARRCRLG